MALMLISIMVIRQYKINYIREENRWRWIWRII